MKRQMQRDWALVTVFTVLFMFLNPGVILAQEHVLPLPDLQRDLRSAAQTRAQNLSDIDRVLSLPAAQQALQKANINPDLQRDLRSAAQTRAQNLSDIDRVLSLPAAQQALQKANINQDQVRKAVSTLNDEELSRFADRARAAEQDVQGGFIVGLLALIGLIVVILVVVAVINK